MYKQILFAVDLTDEVNFVADRVLQLQKYTGAKVSVVHVVEPLSGYSYAYLGIEDIEGQIVVEAKVALKKFAARLNVAEEDQWVEIGPTKAKILSVAEQVKADLIVCGSHGRHGLSLLLGSTANAVLHGARCDVLTVRLPGKT